MTTHQCIRIYWRSVVRRLGFDMELGIRLELVKDPVEMLVIDSNRQSESETENCHRSTSARRFAESERPKENSYRVRISATAIAEDGDAIPKML